MSKNIIIAAVLAAITIAPTPAEAGRTNACFSWHDGDAWGWICGDQWATCYDNGDCEDSEGHEWSEGDASPAGYFFEVASAIGLAPAVGMTYDVTAEDLPLAAAALAQEIDPGAAWFGIGEDEPTAAANPAGIIKVKIRRRAPVPDCNPADPCPKEPYGPTTPPCKCDESGQWCGCPTDSPEHGPGVVVVSAP